MSDIWGAEQAASAGHLVAGGLRPVSLLAHLRAQRHKARYVRDVLALVVAYYTAAHLGYAFEFSGPVAAIVWLPVGVAIAFLYLRGLQLWPGVVLGDLLVNDYSALPLGSAVGQSFGNLLEVVVATLLLRRLCPRGNPLTTIRGVEAMLAAIVTGTCVSATIGSLSAWLGGAIGGATLPYVWRTWWLGDLSGALIVLPLALSWWRPLPEPWPRKRVVEGALMLATVVVLSAITLQSTETTRSLALPALIWAALRFGPRGATLASAVICGFAIWGATHVLGKFGVTSINNHLLDTQLFIAIVSISGLAIASLVSEAQELAERVKASRKRIVASADQTRRRLERDLHDGAQQRLVAVAMRLAMAGEQARSTSEQAFSALDAARAEVLGAIDDVREVAHGIHPAVLREYGLAASIRGIAARSTIPIELEVITVPGARLDLSTEVTAYYIVLEAITNAQKHARATGVSVRVDLHRGALGLEIADDGMGGAAERDGGGLQGLRDRVEAAGGRFSVHTSADLGTRIAATLPVEIGPVQAPAAAGHPPVADLLPSR